LGVQLACKMYLLALVGLWSSYGQLSHYCRCTSIKDEL